MSEAYRAAGVDIDKGNEAVERMKQHVARTNRPEVIGGLGGFGGLFALGSYRDPVLVAATDGVGTKLKVAFAMNRHDTIGIDCVAMCVNDLVVQGAEPLFFLDYLATGKLEPEQVEAVVKGVAEGCLEAGCALIGGETAEMPGMFAPDEYDIAGFSVGVVEREELITGERIQPGDVIIGLASSGLHSNGYSLARRVLLEGRWERINERAAGDDRTLGEVLLTPTRIYVSIFRSMMKKFDIKGGAHITGGGLLENIPRILPKGCHAKLERNAWEIPPIFRQIEEEGNLSTGDLYRTFNMGIGMCLILPLEQADTALTFAESVGEKAWRIGEIVSGEQGCSWIGGEE